MFPKQDPVLAVTHSVASVISLMVAQACPVLGCIPNNQQKC